MRARAPNHALCKLNLANPWSPWINYSLADNLYLIFYFSHQPPCYIERHWFVELQNSSWNSIIPCIFDFDPKFSCIWIDIGDSIGATWCLEANLACGSVAIETEVNGPGHRNLVQCSAERGSGLCHKAHNS